MNCAIHQVNQDLKTDLWGLPRESGNQSFKLARVAGWKVELILAVAFDLRCGFRLSKRGVKFEEKLYLLISKLSITAATTWVPRDPSLLWILDR